MPEVSEVKFGTSRRNALRAFNETRFRYHSLMKRFLNHAVPALIVVSTVMWAAENLYFMKHASARAKQACLAQDSFFDGPNAYYWCLRRVEAGGQP